MGGGYSSYDNNRGYLGSCYIQLRISTYVGGTVIDSQIRLLSYDSNNLYLWGERLAQPDNYIYGVYRSNPLVPIVEYGASDNITLIDHIVDDEELIKNKIELLPASWQQYFNLNSTHYVFELPLK